MPEYVWEELFTVINEDLMNVRRIIILTNEV